MTAKIATRIGRERTPLQDVIPLDTPFLVFLDPSDICNAHCSWCPSGDRNLLQRVGRIPQLMDLSLYMKIIDDLCEMPKPIKTLRLYKDGEPLVHPEFTSMVMYAAKQNRFLTIDTTTNGYLLNKEINGHIHQSGLTKIFISVPKDYDERYIRNVEDLYAWKTTLQIHCKYLTESEGSETDKFLKDFGEICDTISIEYVSPCWPTILLQPTAKGIYGQPLPERAPDVCPYIFYSLAINSDGTVSRCFVDWAHKLLIGDLKKQSFSDVWNGFHLMVLRRNHLARYRFIIPYCRDCQQLLYGDPDNLDPYIDDIRRKYENGFSKT